MELELPGEPGSEGQTGQKRRGDQCSEGAGQCQESELRKGAVPNIEDLGRAEQVQDLLSGAAGSRGHQG